MKLTSILSASVLALALGAPLYAQTATPGIPAALASNPAIQQVNAQLTAQGYTITDIVKNADGSLTILSVDTAGVQRLITIDTTTGAVADTVDTGIPAGTPGVTPEGTLAHESNESPAMEAMENDGGSEGGHNGSHDNDGGSEGGHNGGSDHDGGSEGGHNGGSDHDGGSEGGSDSDD